MKKRRTLLALLLCAVMLCGLCVPASAEESELDQLIAETAHALSSAGGKEGTALADAKVVSPGTSVSDWIAITLARSDEPECYSQYLKKLQSYVEKCYAEDGGLHDVKATEYAAFSQSESESISGNMRWSYQKRMERGEFNTCSAPLGYDLVNGSLIINEECAAVVRSIYEMYLRGINTTEITKTLNQNNVLNIHWQRGRIEYVLRNERYIGDAQLQKKYTTDVFPRKRMRNNGERNSYYITGNHDAIIQQDWFERVQRLFKSREKTVSVEKTPFHGRIQCSCGALCRSKRSTSARYWLCMRHDGDEAACPITQIPETQIQQAFLRLYYNLKHQGSHILPDLITNLQSIRERKFLWSVDVIELNKQIAELTSQNQLLATLREGGCVDPDIFISKSNKLTEQLRAAKQAKSRILNQDGDDTIPCTQELTTILARGPEMLHDFDGELFGQLIDKVIIESNASLRFRLKNGLELRESIERTAR